MHFNPPIESASLARPGGRELDINLRQLQVFLAVAQKGSAAGAAGQLLRASSAVARTVAAIEDMLGVRLFDRHARGMTLNDRGKAVLKRALRIADEIRAFSATLESLAPHASTGALPAVLSNGRRLAMIVALSEKCAMAAVARDFGVSVAAVSASLRDLEGRVGVSFFERGPRGLTSNQAGECAVSCFRRCLAELGHISSDLAALSGAVQGVVTVGALPLSRTALLPKCMATVLRRYPKLQFITRESPYETLIAQLRIGEVDFILGALRSNEPGLAQMALFDDCLSVIVRSGHPLADSARVTLADLSGANWVMWGANSPSRNALQREFTDKGLRSPPVSVETGDLAILRELLLSSDLLAASSSHMLRYEIDRGDLVVLSMDLSSTRRSIGITTRENSLLSIGAQLTIDEIRAEVDCFIAAGVLLAPAPV